MRVINQLSHHWGGPHSHIVNLRLIFFAKQKDHRFPATFGWLVVMPSMGLNIG